MRKYTITIEMPDEYFEPHETAEKELEALNTGKLPVADVLELAEMNDDITITVNVEDVK